MCQIPHGEYDRPMATSHVHSDPDAAHVGQTRQYWRDIILGVNDGLVSMILLVAGVVGGGLTTDQVLLTTVAGAVAGAISMAAGEYLATKSQDEVLEREIKLEREHIRDHRQMELDQLRGMFEEMGVHSSDLDTVVGAFGRSDEILLNAMKSLEFGVIDTERRSPYKAAIYSGLFFLSGSLASIVPFVFVDSTAQGLAIASLLTAAGLFAVGAFKTRVTNGSLLRAGLENVAISGLGGVAAYFIGSLVNQVI